MSTGVTETVTTAVKVTIFFTAFAVIVTIVVTGAYLIFGPKKAEEIIDQVF